MPRPSPASIYSKVAATRLGKDRRPFSIATAVAAAKSPGEATVYALRHSTNTDLDTAGWPLLTIAQISGTCAEMIERHYGHLASDSAVKALGNWRYTGIVFVEPTAVEATIVHMLVTFEPGDDAFWFHLPPCRA